MCIRDRRKGRGIYGAGTVWLAGLRKKAAARRLLSLFIIILIFILRGAPKERWL